MGKRLYFTNPFGHILMGIKTHEYARIKSKISKTVNPCYIVLIAKFTTNRSLKPYDLTL